MARLQLVTLCFATVLFSLSGCEVETTSSTDAEDDHGHSHGPGADHSHPHPHPDEAGHSHAETGPHGGVLVELGHDQEYFAELVTDDATQSAIVYILDADKQAYSLGEPSVMLNLTHGDEVDSFELAAEEESTAEQAGVYRSTDAGLFEQLKNNAEWSIKLRVTIDGTPFVGSAHWHACEDGTHAH